MRATIAFFTRTQRSEQVARAIEHELEARGVAVELFRLRPVRGTTLLGGALLGILRLPAGLMESPTLEDVDMLALVGPVWAGSMAPAMRSLLEALPDLDGRPVLNIVCGFHTCSGVAARMERELQTRDAGRVASRAIGRPVVRDAQRVAKIAREVCTLILGPPRERST